MKWSSSSNSSLSNGSVVTMAFNNSNSSSNATNNNNTSISSSGSNTSSNYGHNVNIIRTTATVRRHESEVGKSDRRSIFYTDPHDMEIFLKNHNNKKVRWIIQFNLVFSVNPHNLSSKKYIYIYSLCSSNIGYDRFIHLVWCCRFHH